MASSRWKRFAFFERQTLAIPDSVLDDLCISSSETAQSLRLGQQQSQRSDCRVSLSVNTASLPAHTNPVVSAKSGPGKSSITTMTMDSKNNPLPTDSVTAMWASLTACSAIVSEEGDSTAAVSMTNASGSIALASQGQALTTASTSTLVNTTTGTGTAATGSPVLDGLVLAFVASPDSSRVHCIDITVRCNPSKTGTTTAVWPNSALSFIEDMDGWRGYWSPFTIVAGDFAAAAAALNSAQQQQLPLPLDVLNSSASSGIVAIASCRVSNATTKNHGNRTRPMLSLSRAHSSLHVACLKAQHELTVWEDPHLHLTCQQPMQDKAVGGDANVYTTAQAGGPAKWNVDNDGLARALDIVPGMVAVGTETGVVLIYIYNASLNALASSRQQQQLLLRPYLRIPAPPTTGVQVVSVQLSLSNDKANVFVAYNRMISSPTGASSSNMSASTTAGICCYDLPLPTLAHSIQTQPFLAAPSARHDLDGRYVGMESLVDSYSQANSEHVLTVARPDGLYSYSHSERIGVAPIDGTKLAICVIPPPFPAEKVREVDLDHVGSGYALVASTDANSGRDVVDIYDATNKLVAFHLLLSPGHKAVKAAGVTTLPIQLPDGNVRGGRSSAVVLTSEGSLVSFTEKLTEEKISLLVQKNLYSAAIVVAYADPSYEAADIILLYQNYAEYLYRKGDFVGAIDQYIHTIGSLESSHVIFRYLDAPKIPLLVKYLEKLRTKEQATLVHNELLRTCYLKLNDIQSAEAISVSASWTINDASLESILSNLASKPKEALATMCSLDANQAAEVLAIHGASLARALPRETAGVVISLCVGTYTPTALAEASMTDTLGHAAATTTAAAIDLNKMVNTSDHPKAMAIDPYPISLFASAFVEHPKILRLLLAHCNRNKCPLTPSLRRALLELTLAEWNQAKRSGDTETEKLRHKEAIASLTDSHCRDVCDYDALVIVQLANFEDGELLLYERLQLTSVLLEKYARDGSEKARRQMLAMCQTDPDLLADVLGHFVEIAIEKLKISENDANKNVPDDGSENDETTEIMEDIQEALTLARRQGVLPPVRIARILAGEGPGQFSSDRVTKGTKKTVPLFVALDYVGTVLEKSRREAFRLKSEIEEYNHLCNSMENEIDSLLRSSNILPAISVDESNSGGVRLSIDNFLAKVKSEEAGGGVDIVSEEVKEAFWREMMQTDDSFDTISRFFAKGVIG